MCKVYVVSELRSEEYGVYEAQRVFKTRKAAEKWIKMLEDLDFEAESWDGEELAQFKIEEFGVC